MVISKVRVALILLHFDGILPIVCPTADDSQFSGLAVCAGSLEEANAIMDAGPAVEAACSPMRSIRCAASREHPAGLTTGAGNNDARTGVRPSSLLDIAGRGKGVSVTITDRMALWRRGRRVLLRCRGRRGA